MPGVCGAVLRLVLQLVLACGALQATRATPVQAQDPEQGPLMLLCDARRSIAALGDTTLLPFPDDHARRARRVPWESLVTVGRARNAWGDPLRTGSRVRTMRCGRLTVRVVAGFLNPNVTGELGAVEFAAVTLLLGDRVVLPRTGLYQCTVGPGREEAYGRCPDRWARALAFAWDARARTGTIVVARTWNDSSFAEQARVDTIAVTGRGRD